ncbi:hypothetical protein [Flagellimonas beolgyonensis]|uniref:hypothetical protein n=1 Tax=Flagellimonas beolgyonensis TaxID=864064 RepID=UPI003D662016
MKKVFLFLLLLTFISCNHQDKNCADFKTGKFKYVLKDRPELIIRSDSSQIEINPVTKIEIYSKLIWKSDCEYVMVYDKILNAPEDVSDMIGQKINVEIIETNNKGYKAHAISPRIDVILEFTKIN